MSTVACPFETYSEGGHRPGLGLCVWCGAVVPRGRFTWCSQGCVTEYRLNHQWSEARSAALQRDGRRCRRCGTGPGRAVLLAALMALWCPAATLSEADVEFWLYRTHPDEWEADLNAGLEVNHIKPRRGKGYGAGCAHHQDNLETLCHRCHVDVTTAQRRGYRGPGADLPIGGTVLRLLR